MNVEHVQKPISLFEVLLVIAHVLPELLGGKIVLETSQVLETAMRTVLEYPVNLQKLL